MSRDRFSVLALVSLMILGGCRSQPASAVERLEGTAEVSGMSLRTLQGTRDGESLAVQAVYGDAAQTLRVSLTFHVAPQARLTSGTWNGLGSEGQAQERSVTFLGGQSGPPSIGGRFDLMGSDNRPLYRVTIPLQELKRPL